MQTTSTEIEALFRREAGRLISVLTRILGLRNLELAEEMSRDWDTRIISSVLVPGLAVCYAECLTICGVTGRARLEARR